ncbi:MAG: esterase [Thermus sp.]|uniref:acyl-CoA thioesterase n=1 Tax=Thermus sp. TaxID=275 RepID=UPI00332D64EF
MRVPIKVRYAETDQMGVVHHSAYVVYLEAARVELLEKAGLPYHELEAQGLFFPVVELSLTYRKPAHFGEVLEVEVRLLELSPRALSFSYRVLRSGEVLAEGRTRHLCLVQGKAGRMSPALLERLRMIQSG